MSTEGVICYQCSVFLINSKASRLALKGSNALSNDSLMVLTETSLTFAKGPLSLARSQRESLASN